MLRVSSALVVLMTGSSGRRQQLAQENVKGTRRARDCGNAHAQKIFDYSATDDWGNTAGWETCGTGQIQSPIDIDIGNAVNVHSDPLSLKFTSQSQVKRENNGHSIEVHGDFANLTLSVGSFAASQFHFHSPSENTVGGESFPLEMHIVMADAKQSLVVVSVLFEEGAENTCLAQTLDNEPETGCDDELAAVDLTDCFTSVMEGDYWSFDGSLTTPPCSEGVKWNVMHKTATISSAQLAAFQAKYTGNNRPTRPLNGRKITHNVVNASDGGGGGPGWIPPTWLATLWLWFHA